MHNIKICTILKSKLHKGGTMEVVNSVPMSVRIEPDNRLWLIKQRYTTGESFTSLINRLLAEDAQRQKEKSIDKKTSS